MKSALTAAAVVLAVALGALAYTFRPERLPIPSLAADALPPARPPAGMTLGALPTGSISSSAAFAYRGGGLRDARDFAITPVLVRHPRGDLLFDAGFGRDVDRHERYAPALMRIASSYEKGTPVADQLSAAGYDPGRLAGVVLTHAHWDHVSGLADLPGVPVWVPEEERAFVASGARMSTLARDLGPLPLRTYAFDGPPYLGFPRSHDVWGDGSVVLVPAPGHTPGSIVAFVTLPSGARYALLGDLVWLVDALALPTDRPWIMRAQVDEDPGAVRESIGRVAAIRARFPEVRMLPAHDARALAALPRFPDAAR